MKKTAVKQDCSEKLLADRGKLLDKVSRIPKRSEMKSEIQDLMHKYNDMKDATQTVIGALCHVSTETFKKVHKDINLPID